MGFCHSSSFSFPSVSCVTRQLRLAFPLDSRRMLLFSMHVPVDSFNGNRTSRRRQSSTLFYYISLLFDTKVEWREVKGTTKYETGSKSITVISRIQCLSLTSPFDALLLCCFSFIVVMCDVSFPPLSCCLIWFTCNTLFCYTKPSSSKTAVILLFVSFYLWLDSLIHSPLNVSFLLFLLTQPFNRM